METLSRFTNFLDRAVLNITAAIFVVMTFSVIYQVYTRYLTATSAPWTEEYARFLFIYVALLGATVAVKRGAHVAVSLLVDRLTGKIKHWVAIFATVMSCCFFGVMIHSGYYSMLKASIQSSPATDTNLGLVYASVPISGALMLLYSIEILLKMLRQGPLPETRDTVAIPKDD